MNYTTLVADKDTEGSIKYFVRHDYVPSDYILERAQDFIYGVLRVREMVAKAEDTIAEGDTTITLPTDLLDPLALYRRGDMKGKITLLDHDHWESRIGEDPDDGNNPYEGTPTEATFDATTLYLNAKADDAYDYRLWYMQKPALLSGSNLTNFLTTKYSHILEAVVKHYAWEHRQDDQKAAQHMEKAVGFITKANQEFDMFRQFMQTELYWR